MSDCNADGMLPLLFSEIHAQDAQDAAVVVRFALGSDALGLLHHDAAEPAFEYAFGPWVRSHLHLALELAFVLALQLRLLLLPWLLVLDHL